MYERREQALIPRREFLHRFSRHVFVAFGIVAASMVIGALGYHQLESMNWVDAILNAAMILGGMGPVSELHTTAGKLFAAGYALYSGMVFLVVVGVLAAPVAHRILHHFHAEIESNDDAAGA